MGIKDVSAQPSINAQPYNKLLATSSAFFSSPTYIVKLHTHTAFKQNYVGLVHTIQIDLHC